jgi:hypothetical protein
VLLQYHIRLLALQFGAAWGNTECLVVVPAKTCFHRGVSGSSLVEPQDSSC